MWYLSPDLLANLAVFEEADGKYYCRSYESGRLRQALPEELIRQLLVIKLVLHYNIPKETIVTEYPIQIGRTKKRADVVAMGPQAKPYIIAEVKTIADADTIFQLQSYVNVTHASYGVIATQVELLTFQLQNGQLQKITDIPVAGAQSESRASVAPPLDLLGFEKLVRVSESDSVLFIQGKNFAVKNADLSAYKKIKKLAIAKGVILPPNISEVHWTRILERLFADANTSDVALTEAGPADAWHSSELARFLIDARQNRRGPFAKTIVTSRAVLSFVRDSGPPNLWQTTTQRGVASILASMGYQTHEYYAMEQGRRVHRHAWYPGPKREFLKLLALESQKIGDGMAQSQPENSDSSSTDSDGFSPDAQTK
ncbi:MAG: hypothetical protein OHK0011_03940 [Turneriella sp.]